MSQDSSVTHSRPVRTHLYEHEYHSEPNGAVCVDRMSTSMITSSHSFGTSTRTSSAFEGFRFINLGSLDFMTINYGYGYPTFEPFNPVGWSPRNP
eukprot:scaffold174150_cov19-Prasinocladus_malaysianus.AAC.1